MEGLTEKLAAFCVIPWLRVERLIRSILQTRWDNRTWPTAKVTLKQALEERKKIRRAGWMN